MPATKSNETEQLTGRSVDLKGHSMRTLVVDDNVNAFEALAAYIAAENIECRTANGGIQAVQIAIEWLPHLIVMDVSMPEMNGVQAALLLREQEATKRIAIIAFTALDFSEVKRQMNDQEFDGYCQKGQPPSELLALAKRFMS